MATTAGDETTVAVSGATAGYSVTMKNGQRKYGPPIDWAGPPPTKGSEVFVGKLPRDILEDTLVPLLEGVGRLYEMRLMMDFDGNNRGFAFAMFATPADATRAIQKLNNYEIRPKRFIGVIRSMDNCRLFVGGIPKDKTEHDIQEEMSRLTEGVVRVILYSSVADKSKNRGFAFVEYESHRAAAVARRKCTPSRLQLWGKNVAIDWAEPEPMVADEVLSKVRVLYVRNLLVTTKEEELQELFNRASDSGVEKVKIIDDFAFVHFSNRQQAQQAMEALHDSLLNGARMHISWAKPVTDKKRSSSASQRPLVKNSTSQCVSTTRPSVLNYNPFAVQPHQLPYQTAYPQYPFYAHRSASHLTGSPNGRLNRMAIDALRIGRGPQLPPSFPNPHPRPDKMIQPSIIYPPQVPHPWTNGFPHNKVEELVTLCHVQLIGDPLFEVWKSGDGRFLAKVSIPNLGPPFNHFQSVESYATEEEARQVIAGCVLSHLNQILSTYGHASALNSHLENLTMNDDRPMAAVLEHY